MLVGVAQIEPKLGAIERNLEACLARIGEAGELGCQLLVLPECAVTGYVYESHDEAQANAQEIPGLATEALEVACGEADLFVVCGLLARDGGELRNRAIVVGPDGILGHYDKTHLPFLGVDRFVTPGEGPLEPFDTPIGKIGIEICYDLRFPEVTRALALAGAEIIAHPTNWPLAARANAEFITRARALENRVFLLTSNRVGIERSAEFCGWSQILDPLGSRLAEADEASEVLLVAEIEPLEARVKDIVPKPGEYEMYLFGDRRPELYGVLVGERDPVESS